MEDSYNSKGKEGRTCLQGQAKRRSKAQSYQEDKLVPYTTAQEKTKQVKIIIKEKVIIPNRGLR